MYTSETKKIHYGIFFVFPFIFIYQIGLWLNVLPNHNGADAILRFAMQFLFSIFGISVAKWLFFVFILIALVLAIIYIIQKKLSIKPLYLLGMLGESLAYAFLFSFLLHIFLSHNLPTLFSFEVNTAVTERLNFSGLHSFWQKIMAAIGAGVFEELLFRVGLMGIIFMALSPKSQNIGDNNNATIKAIGISSFIFTILHIYGGATLFGLISIFSVSILLSLLYLKRGYGIVAMTHAFYDIYLFFGIVG